MGWEPTSKLSLLEKVVVRVSQRRSGSNPSLEEGALPGMVARRVAGKVVPRLSAQVGRRTSLVPSETTVGFFTMVNGVALGDEVPPRRSVVSRSQPAVAIVAAVAAQLRGAPGAQRKRAQFPAATFSPVAARRATNATCCTTLTPRQPLPAEARIRVTRASRKINGTEAKIKIKVLVVWLFLLLRSLSLHAFQWWSQSRSVKQASRIFETLDSGDLGTQFKELAYGSAFAAPLVQKQCWQQRDVSGLSVSFGKNENCRVHR